MSHCESARLSAAVTMLLVIGVAATQLARGGPQPQPVRFNRDIRPILSDNCFKCHGPDEKAREADLRLDQRQSAVGNRGGYAAIVPGRPGASELMRRITAADPDDRMPPPDSGHALTHAQIALLKKWIEQGAEYEPHWAFIAPIRPVPPVRAATVRERSQTYGNGKNADRLPGGRDSYRSVRNPIDAFILDQLARQGLRPSPEAEKHHLIRRVTLDLTGLPPTPAEVETFVTDDSPDAYEKLVDRLLQSPRYGERMATDWLDAARYADTHGYLFDTERYQWRWRDWLIEAFNSNMPFDQFTIEQLAGDLLPDATPQQVIATGFHRNHPINNEAGAIPEEYFVENIVDRVNTTSMVWMGLTMQCAQCHDHKYDPITQAEFYQLYAFFNQVPELGLDGFNKNADPVVRAPTDEQQQALSVLEADIARAEAAFGPLQPQVDSAQSQWEGQHIQPVEPVNEGLAAHWALDQDGSDALGRHHASIQDGSPTFEPGMIGSAMVLDGQRYLEAPGVASYDRGSSFTLAGWIRMNKKEGRQAIFSRMEGPEESYRGFTLQMIEGALSLVLVHRFADDALQVQSRKALQPHEWHHVAATYDGSGKAAGVKLYIDGLPQESDAIIDSFHGSMSTARPLQIGNGHPVAFFKGSFDELRVYDRALTSPEVARLPGLSIHSLLAIPPGHRNEEQARRVRDTYLREHAPAEWRQPYQQMIELRDRRAMMQRTMPTVMVMRHMDKPRPTFTLIRGEYDKRGAKVEAGTPAALPPLEGPADRLGLARWLVDGSHPLTARVIVNRYWQMHFGTGLVETAEDFGTQGQWPSHPDLLDWLATEFVRSGWDVKGLNRLIVTSATYRQSSRLNPELLERDPDNRLLARGPRLRLGAEFIRDQALSLGGLLVEKVGGPSVKPYEPPELWREVAFDTTGLKLTAQLYVQDKGADLYRRGLYTFWKRTAPPATMLTFDAPERERCVVRRDRTNTPLQALVVMNDPTYVEASRMLAERAMREGGSSEGARIEWMLRLATARPPTAEELTATISVFREQLERFTAETSAAEQLLSVGESPRDSSLNAAELAAYSVVANVILNLDEVLTR